MQLVILILAAEPSTSAGCSPSHSRAWASSLGERAADLGGIERRAQRPVAEHLRRQRAPQTGAIEVVIATLPISGGALQRIRGGSGQQPAERVAGKPRERVGPGRPRVRQGRAASCTSTQSSWRARGRQARAGRSAPSRLRRCSAGARLQRPAAARRGAASADRRAAIATHAPAQRGSAINGASAHSITVRPHSGAYCLGTGWPKRRAAARRRHDEPVAQCAPESEAPGHRAAVRVGGLPSASGVRRHDLVEGFVAGDHPKIAARALLERAVAALQVAHFGGELAIALAQPLVLACAAAATALSSRASSCTPLADNHSRYCSSTSNDEQTQRQAISRAAKPST